MDRSWLLTLLFALAAPSAHGQALAFEQVGDRALSASDLAFQGDTLWAIRTDLWRLLPGAAAWEEVERPGGAASHVLPLSEDTLHVSPGVRRTVNGGQTWTTVAPYGEAFFEASSGVVLTGAEDDSGVLYSHDRGATWAFGAFAGGTGSWEPIGEAFAEVPPGHPHAGRLVGGFWGGLAYSDDGGVTWETSSLWENSGRYVAWSVAVGVDGRVYAAFYENLVAGTQVAVSEDGGRTYTVAYTTGVSVSGVGVRIFAVAGGADPSVGVVLRVDYDGTVHRSDDGGVTWEEVGSVPFVYPFPSSHMSDAAVGPEGRLYVSGSRPGTEREWVFRTVEPAVSAAVTTEAVPVGGPITIGAGGGSFQFTVRLTNQTTQPVTFEAWSAVTGPVSREPVVGPQRLTLQPGQSLVRTLTQAVPGLAPAGTYTYAARAGDYPGTVVSEASFSFEKAAGAAPAAGGAEAWTVSGWDAEAAAASALALEVSPNPARGAASVTLSLGAPAAAEVSVYDVLGRRVAVLHEGPLDAGAHTFVLGGVSLPPGVYVVRAIAEHEVTTRTVTLVR